MSESKIKADIVLCTPGLNVSMDWHLRNMYLFASLASKGLRVYLATGRSHNIYIARNSCLRVCPSGMLSDRIDQKPFNGEIDYQHIIWIDSDNLINPDYVERLIAHKVDIVFGWYKGNLGVGENISEDMNRVVCGAWSNVDKEYDNDIMKDFLALPRDEKGLVERDWSGFGLGCFTRRVFESLSYPWFPPKIRYFTDNDGNECARIETDDVSICQRFKNYGFKIFVDPEARILHEKTVAL